MKRTAYKLTFLQARIPSACDTDPRLVWNEAGLMYLRRPGGMRLDLPAMNSREMRVVAAQLLERAREVEAEDVHEPVP